MNRDLDPRIKVKYAAANTSVTAAGSGDATEVTGAAIQRSTIGYPLSAVFVIPYLISLTAAKTFSLAYVVETSASSSSGYSDLVNVSATVIATGALTASAGQVEIPVDLSGAKDYVRIRFTPDLSHTSTDTAGLSAIAVFGSFANLPQ